jgi:hypothetical protein
MVAGVCAVGGSWSGVVVETGVAMGVSQPASKRSRPVTRINPKEEKYSNRFIFYSFIYIPIIAFNQKKSPPEGRGLGWSSGQVLEQALSDLMKVPRIYIPEKCKNPNKTYKFPAFG